MDSNKQKKFMRAVFMYMMTKGMFNNQTQMVTALKSVVTILETQGEISSREKDDCLLYFFQEYAQGCPTSLSDSYIKSSMIPIVYQHGKIDMLLGSSIILVAKNNI